MVSWHDMPLDSNWFILAVDNEQDILSSDDEHLPSDINYANEIEVESGRNPLKECMENDLNLPASNRISYAMGIAMSFMPNFVLLNSKGTYS